MPQRTVLQHIAINCKSREDANIFFTKILDLKLQKSYSLNPELSKQIFNTFKQVDIFVYGDNFIVFEVFITQKEIKHFFEHVCIKLTDKKKFIEKCKKYGLKPYQINKEKKKLLFVKDFSGNLYEIK